MSALPTDKIIKLLENEPGRNSIYQLRKTPDGVVVSINKNLKTKALIQKLAQGSYQTRHPTLCQRLLGKERNWEDTSPILVRGNAT